MIFAAETSTSVEKTRAELESVLRKFKADEFGYLTKEDEAMIAFRAYGKRVRFLLPLPSPTDNQFKRYMRGGNTHWRSPEGAHKEWEQACRSAWRALFLCVKAKLVAVDAKITTFEQEFMAHIVLPDGRTVGESVMPAINKAYEGLPFNLTLSLPDKTKP